MEGKFNPKYFITGGGVETWWKAAGYGFRLFLIFLLIVLLAAGGISLWRFFFPVADKQINRPRVVAMLGAKIDKIDQSNVQVLLEEKKWSVSVAGGQLNWDGRNGWFLGGMVTRKW